MKKFLLFLFLIAFTTSLSYGAPTAPEYGPTGQESPAIGDYTITPSDTVRLDPVPRGVYIGVSGDLKVWLMHSPAPVTYVGVPQGIILPIRPVLVYSTGTTASSLNGMY